MNEGHSVRLEVFEGPLDLLLYLIQKNDLDIADIRICEITAEYLAYVELMKELNLALAGEFLVMAATLIQIKARSLLPAAEAEPGEGPDPRAELVAKLLEYQRYKEAAQFLSEKAESVKDIFYRGAPVFSKDEMVLEVSLFELMDAFQDVLSQAKAEVREILIEEIPVERRIQEILQILSEKETVSFKDLFKRDSTRREMIVTFLAILELIRLRNVSVLQSETFGDIWIRARSPEPAAVAEA